MPIYVADILKNLKRFEKDTHVFDEFGDRKPVILINGIEGAINENAQVYGVFEAEIRESATLSEVGSDVIFYILEGTGPLIERVPMFFVRNWLNCALKTICDSNRIDMAEGFNQSERVMRLVSSMKLTPQKQGRIIQTMPQKEFILTLKLVSSFNEFCKLKHDINLLDDTDTIFYHGYRMESTPKDIISIGEFWCSSMDANMSTNFLFSCTHEKFTGRKEIF